jgi:hypothetical protein
MEIQRLKEQQGFKTKKPLDYLQRPLFVVRRGIEPLFQE